jgi:mono/diheme cytochrome c family protein
MLKEKGVTNVANYVKSISDNTFDEEKHAAGQAKYRQVCAGCHGVKTLDPKLALLPFYHA